MTFRKSLLTLVCAALAAGATMPAAIAEDAAPPKPALPKIVSLSVQPAALTLEDSRDARSLIVTGKTAAGYMVDLSPVAVVKAAAPVVRVDKDGYVQPVKAGSTHLTIAAAGQRIDVPVTVKSVSAPPVSFVREVMPILSKAGCNAGTCHGSAKGKNGFKLSLRGYDPDYDHHALVDDIEGRRFNRTDPAHSLMLLKPLGEVPHKGGVAIRPNSRYYALLKQWIAEGVVSDMDRVKRVARLEVLPSVPNLTLPGLTQKSLVLAHYPDGTTRDVTREAVLTSSMPETATVKPTGEITAIRRGEAALLVRYEGTYATTPLTVLGARKGYQWAGVTQLNYIDKLVDQKLQKIKAVPSGLCDDSTFLRRVSIDLTGLPPTPEQARAFIEDKTSSSAKREKIVDALLGSPSYADRWTNKWADLLDCNSKFLGDKGVRKFRNWIHAAVAENMPYDKFVRAMVTASGDAYENAPANYLRVVRDTATATENVTQLFLGVRFSCNKCHDHPFERWTQNQYYEFGAFFAQVSFKPGQQPGDEVVYDKAGGEVMHPKTSMAVTPLVPVGHLARTADFRTGTERRDLLADWLTSKENPFFSRAMVNRLWSYFLGKGIIDPVDDIRASNPPSNPQLLESLNKDFVDSGFDLKHMMRRIVLSRTYQADLRANIWNADDKTNFSHAVPRRLEAEQLLDAIHIATNTDTNFAGLPVGTRANALPDANVPGGDGFLDLFGKPSRDTPCECERSSTVSLGQALNLINGPTISDAIASPQGRIAQLMKANLSNDKLIEEIFLSVVSRMPTAKEKQNAISHITKAVNRSEGAQDLMWALINSPAFLFNR
jgi:Protein of unknown function (DUF1549)/Protein of unknown function (DUF1553)